MCMIGNFTAITSLVLFQVTWVILPTWWAWICT